MIVLSWILFALLAVFWTGAAWISAAAAEWAAQALASGTAAQAAQDLASVPLPEWLKVWIDPAWFDALQSALRWAIDNGHSEMHVRADSELLVKQMLGEYKVKHEGLKPLVARARLLCMELGRVTFEHVRREHNKKADALSNVGMDEAEAAV